MSLTPHSGGSTVAGDTPVTVRPDLHPGTGAALSELVLVDQHEAQGWRVRRAELAAEALDQHEVEDREQQRREIGDGAVIGPDSFLMKGEEVPPGERWAGNPAQEMNDGVAAPQARPAHPDGTAPAASALEIRDVPASGARPDAGPDWAAALFAGR
jgi:hypothetical protein